MTIQSKHILSYCGLCQCEMVICAVCENNCCNGSTREVNGKKCGCEEAYAHQDVLWHNPENIEFEMKSYPSITADTDVLTNKGQHIYAFDKLDGSQIRAEWSKQKRWHKFATRKHLIDSTDPVFGYAPTLVSQKYGESLEKVFLEQGWPRVVCFFEFFGKSSFAGQHYKEEKQDVVLFDVSPINVGLLNPSKFIELFGHLDIPKVLYQGDVNDAFLSSVRNGTLPGMTFEGVVCKTDGHKQNTGLSFKVKNRAWLEKLKTKCGENEELFKTLA